MKLESGALARARVRAARTPEEIDAARRILESDRPREFAESYPDERGCTRILEIDGEAMAAVLFAPAPIQVRGRAVRCARLVEVPGEDGRPHFRETGDRELFDFLIEELMGYLWARGYPLAYAHGELALFPQHGFVPCFLHPRVYVDVEAAVSLPSPYRVRLLKSDDIRRIPALKAQHADSKPVVYASGVPRFHHFSVEDPQREVRGCFGLHVDRDSDWLPRVFAPEVEAEDRAAAESIVRHCALKAKEIGEKEIHFALAPTHPVARVCLEIGGRASLIAASGDAAKSEEMLAMVERAALVRALALPPIPRETAIRTERGTFLLRAEEGATALVPTAAPPADAIGIPDWAFTQLVAGYRAAEEIDAAMPDDARAALAAVFPKCWPYSVPDPDLWDDIPPRHKLSKAARAHVASIELPWR